MNRFLLSLFPAPESRLQLPKLLIPLSAVRLNLPKNTLRWLALVGFLRFYPQFPAPVLPAVRLPPVWSEHLPN
jgi:hypothetical protein